MYNDGDLCVLQFPSSPPEFFVARTVRDELSVNMLLGVADPGAVILTDHEGIPYGPYESYTEAKAQITIIRWASDVERGL